MNRENPRKKVRGIVIILFVPKSLQLSPKQQKSSYLLHAVFFAGIDYIAGTRSSLVHTILIQELHTASEQLDITTFH